MQDITKLREEAGRQFDAMIKRLDGVFERSLKWPSGAEGTEQGMKRPEGSNIESRDLEQ